MLSGWNHFFVCTLASVVLFLLTATFSLCMSTCYLISVCWLQFSLSLSIWVSEWVCSQGITVFPTLGHFSLQSGCLCVCAVCYVWPVSIPSAVLATRPARQCMTCVTKPYGYVHTIIILTDLMNLLLTESEKWNGWMPSWLTCQCLTSTFGNSGCTALDMPGVKKNY